MTRALALSSRWLRRGLSSPVSGVDLGEYRALEALAAYRRLGRPPPSLSGCPGRHAAAFA